MFAGRISPEKNIEFLVELTKRYAHRGVWLAIIGDGPASSQFECLHGAASHVHFVPGFVRQDALATMYAASDAVCSASEFETFGFTSLEAMACGSPFFGAHAQGFCDVVKSGVGGLLFKPGDFDDASKKLEILLKDKANGCASMDAQGGRTPRCPHPRCLAGPRFNEKNVTESCREYTAEACVQRTLEACVGACSAALPGFRRLDVPSFLLIPSALSR